MNKGTEQAMEKKKVLVVDDSILVRFVVADELTKLGYEAISANTAEKALKACRSKKPDLVLLDVMLPDIDGFETCRRLKSDPETRYIPVVFMTAKDKEQDIQAGRQAGGAGYLVKPFESDELSKILVKHIGRSGLW
ncbi:MAG: response regulator [Candidatus Aureabacteria bacterium]|nr:response regulator [Candidatus Auribacterota bacterium]